MLKKLHFTNPFMLNSIILAIIIQLIFINCAICQNKASELDKLMTHCYLNGTFNGTILVSENGKIIYRNAFGYSDKATKRQLKPESCFDLASVSKQFTAMAIMILKERKKLSYEDKLTKYFPEFSTYANDVSIRNLLNHTSGLPNYQSYDDATYLTNSDIYHILIKQNKLVFKTGDKYSYNNYGYNMLALIIEKVSGQTLTKFLTENIFDPLNMKNTLLCDNFNCNLENRAVGYNLIGEKDDFKISCTGSTGIFSNVDDLFLWDQSLYTQKIVSITTINEAFNFPKLNDGSVSNYGFGWKLNKDNQNKTVEHSGSDFGYRTFIKRNITKNTSYILLSNNGDAVALNEINLAIDDILASNPYKFPKIPVYSTLQKALENNSLEKAIKIARNEVRKAPENFNFHDQMIDELGYKYLYANKTNEAFSLFKFNRDLNPKSPRVYNSLGEIYLIFKDTINAVENYKKSLQLDPNNSNAIKALSRFRVTTDETIQNIIISPEVLKTYEGKYQLNKNYFFNVTIGKNQLFIQGTGEASTTVFPMSQNKFYSKIVTAQFTFNKDKNGKIDSLTLNMGSELIAKKLN